MASHPNTWSVLQAIQGVIQSEVTVATTIDNGSNTSPFSLFTAADAATYGTTNAIYLGMPKDFPVSEYAAACFIIPPQPDHPQRRSEGGKIWQRQHIKLVLAFAYTRNAFAAIQFCVQAADALAPVLLRHAASGWGPTTASSKLVEQGSAGYFFDTTSEQPYYCWGQVLEVIQEYNIAGGIVE